MLDPKGLVGAGDIPPHFHSRTMVGLLAPTHAFVGFILGQRASPGIEPSLQLTSFKADSPTNFRMWHLAIAHQLVACALA
jgi:hypothetical protein